MHHFIVPVIMSGGSGTRLWPLSTNVQPKQFHALTGEQTMLQETLARLKGSPFADRPIIICNASHRDTVREQLAASGVEAEAVVLEPSARNTAAVAAVAAELVRRRHPGALALLLPADHMVGDPAGFREMVQRGATVTDRAIVTFGIRPSGPETGYGYIRRGSPLAEGCYAVDAFLEKPDLARARTYVEAGNYEWNAGIFLFDPRLMIEELNTFRPDVGAAAAQALDRAGRDDEIVALDPEAFAACPSISVDYAVMEQTRRAAVVPCDIGWADIGSWSELWSICDRDDHEVVHRGETVAVDARESLIWSTDRPVALIGLSGVIVVSTPQGVLVAAKDRAQDVKQAVERLRAASRPGD